MVNHIYIPGNRTLCSQPPCTSDVPVATVDYPKLQEIILEESSSLQCGLVADPFPVQAPEQRLVFPWVKCSQNPSAAVRALYLPGVRLVPVVTEQPEFTLGQQSTSPSSPWSTPVAHSLCFPWDSREEKNTQAKKIYCLLHVNCCFSHILLLITSRKSLAWASRTVPHLYFPDLWWVVLFYHKQCQP